MRNLIALFACLSVVMATASANDPPAASAPPAAAKPAPEPAKPVVAPAKPKLSPAQAAAAQAQAEADAEAELSAKISTRLAAMRANQAARVAAAAKARKAADARRKQEALVASVAAPAAVKPYPGNHWSYEGETGPANWGRNPEWSKCATGSRQSPIDLRDSMKVDLEQIVFDYKPSSFSVVDNGHTVEVTVSGGNFITVQNRSYELLQFHFHRPSEERINGKGFEMVVHLVHRDAESKLAVVAVLLERGKAHNMIQTVWNNLPLEKHDVVNPAVVLDVNEVLPQKRDYFTYMGSLTTPPCSEGVLWMVMKEPQQASPAQMALFSRLYPLNARPIQAGLGRVVKESN
ncbi:MAG: carbonic anhydrase family protein [Pseudomonadota bacterium]